MSTNWVSILKVAGPLVSELTDSFDRFAEVPTIAPRARAPEVWAADAAIREHSAFQRIKRFVQLLETNAVRPPVLFCAKYIDPWTVAPALLLQSELSRIGIECQVAQASELSFLFIKPDSWPGFQEGIEKLLHQIELRGPIEFERRFLLSVLREAATSWEAMLSANRFERILVLRFEAVDGSWLSDEVIHECSFVPQWYQNNK